MSLSAACIFSDSASESPAMAVEAGVSDMRFPFQIIGFAAFLAVLSVSWQLDLVSVFPGCQDPSLGRLRQLTGQTSQGQGLERVAMAMGGQENKIGRLLVYGLLGISTLALLGGCDWLGGGTSNTARMRPGAERQVTASG